MTTLTSLQIAVLNEYARCEMNGANGGTKWLATSGNSEDTWTYLWADEHAANLGISEQSLGGVLTSLQTAGLITMTAPSRGDKDGSFKMTEAGFEAWKNNFHTGPIKLDPAMEEAKEIVAKIEATEAANFIVTITSIKGLSFTAPVRAENAGEAIKLARAAVKDAGISRSVGRIDFRAKKA